jgi:hypothetical protein
VNERALNEAGQKKPGRMPGRKELVLKTASAGDLQVDRLGAFAAAIRFRFEAYLLVLGEAVQARGLHSGDVYEDIRTTIVGLDETEALFGVEEFYSASFGHASGPFLSARGGGQHFRLPPRGREAGSSDVRKGSCFTAASQALFLMELISTAARIFYRVSGALLLKVFPCPQIARTREACCVYDELASKSFKHFMTRPGLVVFQRVGQ